MNSNNLGDKVQALNRQDPTQFLPQNQKADMSFDDNALSLGSRASTTTQAATEEAKGSVAETTTIPAEKSDAAP